jgi:hypothetical protein
MAVDVGEPEEPADPVHHRDHRRVHQSAVTEPADVQLDVGALDADQRFEVMDFRTTRTTPEAGRRTGRECARCRPKYETAACCAADMDAGWNGNRT